MSFYVRITKIIDMPTDDDQTYKDNLDRAQQLDAQGVLFHTFDIGMVDEQGNPVTEKQFEDATT